MRVFSLLVTLIVAFPVLGEEVVIDLDGPSAEVLTGSTGPPPPPQPTQQTHSCPDKSTYTCLSNSTQCFESSPVYCSFSVELVKDISK
jgi:hypothetical protein